MQRSYRPIGSAALTVAVAAALGGFAPAGVEAQVVMGSVLDASSEAPLEGVLVSLFDFDGERVRATLSDDEGRFYFEVEGFGRYSLRAERIGLQTTTSASFDVFGSEPRVERILMGDRAIEIEGLVVDSRVKACRLDSRDAVQIQRWWREVRTALDVSSVVQSAGLATFEIDRFEREWGPKLERLVSETSRSEMSLTDRPFVSAEAELLSRGGFVQGELEGQREYYAPDADVLLSSVFLTEHCFSLEEHEDDERLIGLAFEPVEDRDVPDIRGVLWVDSTTAELRTLDFRYHGVEDVPDNESGGQVSFEVLESGAWVVRDWYIRMPKLGQEQVRRNRTRLVLLGYVDVGGRLRPVEATRVAAGGAIGSIHGEVWDSIRGRGLAGATVSVLGTSLRTVTDEQGAFVLDGVPVGEQRVTFVHDDPSAWGLGAPYATLEVEEDESRYAYLAVPGFRSAARILCLGTGSDAETVLIGRFEYSDGTSLGDVRLRLTWADRVTRELANEHAVEARTGSDGSFGVCTIPAESVVTVHAELSGRLVRAFEVELPARQIVFRRVTVPLP